MFTFFKNSISISELGCLFILRPSGFAPSTRRWTRPWAERDRMWRQAARCRSWSLPSPEQLRTRFIRKGDWRMRHMRVAGCLESPTAGWMFTLLHLHLDNFTCMLRNWKVFFFVLFCLFSQRCFEMVWWENIYWGIQEWTRRWVSAGA